jgi:hypothetical protein
LELAGTGPRRKENCEGTHNTSTGTQEHTKAPSSLLLRGTKVLLLSYSPSQQVINNSNQRIIPSRVGKQFQIEDSLESKEEKKIAIEQAS